MTLKKILVSVFAVLLSSAAFAFPAPPDDDPTAAMLEQYITQLEEMNKKFDEQILPPLKGLLKIAQEFGESTQDNLTPEQEKEWNKYQTALTKAFTDMVSPVVEKTDMAQINEMFKHIFAAAGQPAQEITEQEFTDMLIGMIAINALNHFQETKKLTEEELELAILLFFPQEENALE